MLTPAEIAPDRVAVYIRWSTDDQGEGTTLQTQLERCRHYLASQGWRFRDELLYIDDGYSGGTLDRPGLTRLRADVAEGRIQCVVVYKIDRLSRSVVDIVQLVLREWEGRCFIKSASEEVNTLSPAGKMFFYILVSFAEYERSLIRERTLAGKVKRAEQGLNPGFRPPFGLRRGEATGSFALVPAEARQVRQAFQWCAAGLTPAAIARRWQAAGALRRGSPWTAQAVRRILRNPAYTGALVYGRSGRGRPQAPPRHARVEGALPAIVSPELWEQVQRRLERRRQQTPARLTPLLAGLARCPCGAPMGVKRAGSRQYYYCLARRRAGPAACDRPGLAAAEADAAVSAQMARLFPEWQGLTTADLHRRRTILQRLLKAVLLTDPPQLILA